MHLLYWFLLLKENDCIIQNCPFKKNGLHQIMDLWMNEQMKDLIDIGMHLFLKFPLVPVRILKNEDMKVSWISAPRFYSGRCHCDVQNRWITIYLHIAQGCLFWYNKVVTTSGCLDSQCLSLSFVNGFPWLLKTQKWIRWNPQTF